jgi:predicted nucleotide-binding protein
MAKQASFAILVHTSEDEQAGGGQRARQNVVHETGLFQGLLGIRRAIVLRQRGCEDFSNIAGVQELHYTNEIREAFGEVVAVLRREFPAMSL